MSSDRSLKDNSFRAQLGTRLDNRRASFFRSGSIEEKMELAGQIDDATHDIAAPFESKFSPKDMHQLALVAHNHMKPAMKEFVTTYSEILQKFRITGTNTTMRMCKTLWGEDNPNVDYGLTCTSGPLGGDAQIAALMCVEDLGGLIFFVDPLSAHPHQADIDSLCRLSNCGNIIVCNNPASAMSLMHTLKCSLENGNRGMIPSFFETLESPAVAEYKYQQELALHSAVASVKSSFSHGTPHPGIDDSYSMGVISTDMGKVLEMKDENNESSDSDIDNEEALAAIQELRDSLVSTTSGRPQRRASQALTGLKVPAKKKSGTRKMLVKSIKSSVKRIHMAGAK